MQILDIKSFIKTNESYQYDITRITDHNEIKQKLIHISKESEKYPLYCEFHNHVDSSDKHIDIKRKELTDSLASLDIQKEQLQDIEIQKLLSHILFNSLKQYFNEQLDQLYVTDKFPDWTDGEPGEPGEWTTEYEFSDDLETMLSKISGENIQFKTYDLCLYYNNETGNPVYYYEGIAVDDTNLEYDIPEIETELESDIDFYDEFDKMFNDWCKELEKYYDLDE